MSKPFDFHLTEQQEAQLALTILRNQRPELTKRARAVWLLHDRISCDDQTV